MASRVRGGSTTALMAKPKRNDPCPCGSGKKYKNCCLTKDRSQRIRESAWRREEQVTLDKLIAFSQRPEFQPQLLVAFNLFWNGAYGVEAFNSLERDEIGRFFDWYAYDYRLEETKQRVIDVFIEEAGQRLSPGELQRVRAWSDSYLSLYRIVGAGTAGSLSVLDVLQAQTVSAGDDGLGRIGLPGDLVVGRLLRSSQPPHLSWAAILLPAEDEEGLASLMGKAYGQYEETNLRPSWPDFLSRHGYMFNHYLLRVAAEASSAERAAGKYYDGTDTIAVLRNAERQVRARAFQELEQQEMDEERQVEESGPPLRETRGGILLPGHVEYKGSKERKR